MLDDKAPPNKRLRRGAIIRLQKDDKGGWQISQLPEVESAFVAVDPKDGAIRALVGGFDFNRNKFNHVTQAWRQPGSSFKPFIYSAALEKGFSPGTVINDEPIVIPASQTGSQAWEPHNYDGKYEGPMKMRTALAKSKNMVSIRILQSIGTHYAQDYASRFGFDAEKHPPYLTMALGAGSVTPWQMVTAYSVFANGGYRINPYIVSEIRDEKDQVLAQAAPIAGRRRDVDPRHRPAQRLHDGQHAARRDHLRHRRQGFRGPQAPGSGGQDRHHQRICRCLVLRLSDDRRRLRLGRLRPAEETRRQGNRRGRRVADLDRLHGPRAQGRADTDYRSTGRPGRLRQRT
jgi:membrane carboxypeptidase/penicillin-binding protein